VEKYEFKVLLIKKAMILPQSRKDCKRNQRLEIYFGVFSSTKVYMAYIDGGSIPFNDENEWQVYVLESICWNKGMDRFRPHAPQL